MELLEGDGTVRFIVSDIPQCDGLADPVGPIRLKLFPDFMIHHLCKPRCSWLPSSCLAVLSSSGHFSSIIQPLGDGC